MRLARHLIMISLLTAWTIPAGAQQLEQTPPPQAEPRATAYLAQPVDYRLLLVEPPAAGDDVDRTDMATVERLQSVPEARWQSANLDSDYVYPRFDEAFGRPVTRATSPAMIRLLNRALRDVGATAFAAKSHFNRPRPYQREQLTRVCGAAHPPRPEPRPTSGSSYPSGHSAYGWATAMILARLAPDRAEQLLARAAQYAESRLICGVHFPTDIVAGRLVAIAVVNRLDADPDFQRDLAAARAQLVAR